MRMYSLRESVPESVQNELAPYSELVRALLYARGITTQEEANAFLNPNYDTQQHDPFLMKGMESAARRILEAMNRNEVIGIYTDYDCDGGPGGVIMHDFFKKIGYDNFINYIPHRHKEGYGLNNEAITQLHEQGATLMVTVDLGITDVAQVDHANSLGVDVIITDHHLPGKELPKAYAILNPKQEDDQYPFDGLCGTGVAYKLIQALIKKGSFDLKEGWEKWWLDMVGLATVADMVPLRDENRVFAHFGLHVLRKSPRLGIMKLCRKMNIRQQFLSEDDIGFMIAPRINAASRMGEAMDAFRLLTTEDEVTADELAKHLDKINNERKGLVAAMAKEIKKRLISIDIQEVIVLGSVKWRPALLGLAANSLVEEYNRPVFLWGREESNILKGSCRSDGSVDLVELMTETKESFIEFGGHKFSGGFSVVQDDLPTLEKKLSAAYIRVKQETEEEIYIDRKLSLEEVSWETYRDIEKLAPFGEGNPKPLFLFENIVPSAINYFGKTKEHIKLSFSREQGGPVEAIQFFVKDERLKTLTPGIPISVVANLDKSFFRFKPELRLRIVDLL